MCDLSLYEEETKTIYLSDFDMEKLIRGSSVSKGKILITFAEGSKRYCEVKK